MTLRRTLLATLALVATACGGSGRGVEVTGDALRIDADVVDGGGFAPMSFPGSFLATVVQATYLRVDEAGTEAAAVTAGSVEESAGEVIAVDRSFAFVIREVATGAELFVGTIGDPTA